MQGAGGEKSESAVTRRAILNRTLAIASAALMSTVVPSTVPRSGAAGVDLAPVAGELIDSPNYSFRAPSGFSKTIGSLSGGRIATIFIADDDGDSNVTMVETGVQSDFQKLTSFGSVDNFLTTVVPTSVAGNKVLSVTEDTQKNAYVIEYILKPPGSAPARHLITVFSLQPGQYLFTLTGQSKEENWNAKKDALLATAQSFTLKARS
jgi:PsbP